MKLKNALVEAASEPPLSFCTVVPFTIDNLECNVFVRRTRNEANDASIVFTSFCGDLASPPPALAVLSYRPSLVWLAVPLLAVLVFALRRRRAREAAPDHSEDGPTA